MNDIKYDKDNFFFAYRVSALIYNKDIIILWRK